MFKFMFRVITISLFLVFLTIGIAIWKGGEPFRWCGEGLVMIGETVSHFGDFVDKLTDGGRKIQKITDVINEDNGN